MQLLACFCGLRVQWQFHSFSLHSIVLVGLVISAWRSPCSLLAGVCYRLLGKPLQSHELQALLCPEILRPAGTLTGASHHSPLPQDSLNTQAWRPPSTKWTTLHFTWRHSWCRQAIEMSPPWKPQVQSQGARHFAVVAHWIILLTHLDFKQ